MSVEPVHEEAEIPAQRLEPEGCAAIRREDVQMLCSMGIPEAMAEQGLLLTGGKSVQNAAAWYFDQIENESTVEAEEKKVLLNVAASNLPLPITPGPGRNPGSTPFKMVFVVNAELKMGKGEMAAQVAHACLGLYRLIKQDSFGLQEWKAVGETKEVLSGLNAEHLQDLQRRASATMLSFYPTRDTRGKQIPSDSCTVLCIFGEASKIDQITGTLCLL